VLAARLRPCWMTVVMTITASTDASVQIIDPRNELTRRAYARHSLLFR
jgi:hypothetical protein